MIYIVIVKTLVLKYSKWKREEGGEREEKRRVRKGEGRERHREGGGEEAEEKKRGKGENHCLHS